MERLAFEKRDLENKLAAQKLSLEKCEQDKDAMENYYDRKWNKEYANVKQQLERTFAERIASMETQCALRVEGLERAAR
jgi:hypothetical protein